VDESANGKIMKQEPKAVMGGIGYFLQIYLSPNNPGKWFLTFEDRVSWGDLTGIPSACERTIGVSTTTQVAGGLTPFVLSPTTTFICELLLASSRLLYCVLRENDDWSKTSLDSLSSRLQTI
jgi:hypothetical protein